jgi:uncharacterized protein (TIGR02646 family)
MIKINKPKEQPSILLEKGKYEKEILCIAYDKGERSFDFDRHIYSHEDVKESLINIQHKKCCYCESKFKHIYPGDIEHFRPKGAVQQNKKDKIQKPGYYWLAYEWSNLLFSCHRCNNLKRNLFPLKNSEKRANNHHNDISIEEPLLINPAETDPANYISFRRHIAIPINDNKIGEKNIQLLELNRDDLKEARMERLDNFTIFNIISKNPSYSPKLQQKAKKMLENAKEDKAEFAGMLRQAHSKKGGIL